MINEHDILIVGGGMIGLLTAVALTKMTDLSIGMIDREKIHFNWDNSIYSPRVSAVTLASKNCLTELGVWPLIVERRLAAFKRMVIEDTLSKTQFDFNSRDIGKPALGYIIENDVMRAAAYDCLKNNAQIHFYAPCELTGLSYSHKKRQLIAANNTTFLGRLIIGADGARSWLREKAGIPIQYHHYDAISITAMVKTEKPHQHTAYQLFLKTGPLAFLPLSNPHHASIVWSLPKEKALEYMMLSDAEFNACITTVARAQLGDIILLDKRYALPLVKQEALSYIAEGVALVGDAAHVVHPLAGQGVNLGISDIKSLLAALFYAKKHQHDLATHSTLRRYERAAKAETYCMIKAIDVIHYCFVDQVSRYTWMRQPLLKLLQASSLIKQQIMRVATE